MRSIAVTIVLALVTLAHASSSPKKPPDPKEPAKPAVAVSIQCIVGPKDEADPQPFVYRIARTGDLSKPLKVWISTGGTMTSGEDYVPPPPFIVIPAGKGSTSLEIQGIDDDVAEGVETLEVSVSLETPKPKQPPATKPS